MRIINFIVDIIKGLYYKYPLCCILEYAKVSYKGEAPANRIWELFEMSDNLIIKEATTHQHVLCDSCMFKYLGEKFNEN